ncbi:MAG: cation-translocating P-type ATPase, partial [Nitrosomonadales bacterium]|nr:cation-translocating P-type ATPase [Nitrosomonadales bacterium]
LPEPWHELVEIGVLASERAPFDPMEHALHELGRRTLSGTEHLHSTWELVHEYSLSPDLLAMSHVWRGQGEARHTVATKGAPEAVIDLCHLPAQEAEEIARAAGEMADHGLRVLGVARAELKLGQWPERQHDIDFTFVGLVGLQDPLRKEVPQAVAVCRDAGIRVVMISGDYARTAQAIARELGLPEAVLTGAELDALSDSDLCLRVREIQVFARITPQQKLRLVEAFKVDGEVVAMTGDGVNDAPALKAAHIGVAMGARGTDVAREAAGLVLLNDNFSSLVATVRLGRRIYDNLRKAMSYTLAVHIPIVGMALLPVLLGGPLMLMPAHVLFLEMIIDPVCSIFFEAEPEEQDVMLRPPRNPAEQLFGGLVMLNSILQGLSAFAVAAAIYLWATTAGLGENQLRALVFAALVAGNVALVKANRAQGRLWQIKAEHNPAFRWVVLGVSTGLLLVFSVPLLREVFHFDGNVLHLMGTALLAAGAVLLLNMLIRWYFGKKPLAVTG